LIRYGGCQVERRCNGLGPATLGLFVHKGASYYRR
jgi:hypothetical protein